MPPPAPVPIEIIHASHAAAEADRARDDALRGLQRADRADGQALQNPEVQAFDARELRQEVRNEKRDDDLHARQDVWREQVDANAPRPGQGRPPDDGGIKVLDGATGVVCGLGDFMVGLLAGPSAQPAAPSTDIRSFLTDPAARKAQQLADLAADRAAHADQKAREHMYQDMQAGRGLRAEDIRSLTYEHQMQLRSRGDDAVREMVDDARKRMDSHWLGEERERDR
jgi:hypothetical protein